MVLEIVLVSVITVKFILLINEINCLECSDDVVILSEDLSKLQFFLTSWMTEYRWVLRPQSVKWCCRTGFPLNRTLFLQGINWVRRIDLVTLAVVYGLETLSLGQMYADFRLLEHHRLRNIGRIQWEDFVSKGEVRRAVSGPRVRSLEILNMNRLKWLRHVFRMPIRRGKLVLEDGSRWPVIDMGKSMKMLTSG